MATTAQAADTLPNLDHGSVHRGAQRSMAVMATRYGLVLLVNVVSITYLSRLVGPAIWGTFAVAQFVMNASQEVFGRGFASYLIKKNSAPESSELSAVLALQAIGGFGILAAMTTTGLIVLSRTDATVAWLYIAAGFYGLSCASRAIPLAIAERQMRYGTIAGVEILEAFAFNGVALLCVRHGFVIEGLAGAVIARSTLPTALAFILQPVSAITRFGRSAVNSVLSFGVPFTATSCVSIFILSVPVILVGFIADRRNVGLAQMSFSLYSTLLFPTAAILRIGLSALSRLSDSPDALLTFVNSTLRLMSLWVLPVVVAFSGTSPIWVRAFLGEQWHELPVLLILIAPAYMIAGVFWGVLNPALFVRNRGRFLLGYQVVFVLLYATLTVVGTLLFGIKGVAIAWLITHLALYPVLIAQFDSAIFRNPVITQIAIACVSALALFCASLSHSLTSAAFVATGYLLVWVFTNRSSLASVRFQNLRLLFSDRIGG